MLGASPLLFVFVVLMRHIHLEPLLTNLNFNVHTALFEQEKKEEKPKIMNCMCLFKKNPVLERKHHR